MHSPRRWPVAALALLVLASAAAAEGVKKRVKFDRGKSSATIKWAVVRGERDRYLLGGKAGQRMQVSITSPEDNAVFQILRPDGKALPGAEEGKDATKWSGKLPKSGDYTLVVGGTRGNATYTLKVVIR